MIVTIKKRNEMRNKTNVNYVKIKYLQVDKQIRCFLTYEIDLTGWPINGFKIDANVLFRIADKLGFDYYDVEKKSNYPTKIGFTTTAQAACDIESDEFDEKTGKNIALTRAQAKAFEKTCKFYDLLQIELDKSFNEITRIIDNNWHAANKCWEHAKGLGNY